MMKNLLTPKFDMSNPSVRLGTLLGVIMLATLPMTSHAKLYKWVDENGNVQYSDKLPPQANQGAHAVMSEKSGRQVESKGAAKTPEEIAQEQELERLRKIQEELVKKQKAEDEVLLKTFRSEDDLVRARDAKISTLDNHITITQGNLNRFKSQLTSLQSRAAAQEKAGKNVDAKINEDIKALERQIDSGYASILKREQAKQEIVEEYDRDIQRFRTLKKIDEPKSKAAISKSVLPLQTVYQCTSEDDCEQIWENAIEFVKKNSETSLQLVGNNLYMTKSPETDDQISLTVTRIKDSESGMEKVFLDQQCRTTENGKAFCGSEKSKAMKASFIPSITGKAGN